MTPPSHPSFLELDRIQLGAGSAQAREHLAHCSACAEHFKRLDMPAPVPQAVVGLEKQKITSPWKKWPMLVLAATSALVVLLVPTVINQTHKSDVLRVKAGNPAIAVFIKRGDTTTLWDGLSSVHPGDQIRLEVAPSGFRHVRVTAPTTSGASQVLYEGDVPADRSSLLPLSFQVDESGTSEMLDITLSNGPVFARTWSTHLLFTKTPSLGVPK